MNLVSKSGTNVWHGSLFENHQNSARERALADRCGEAAPDLQPVWRLAGRGDEEEPHLRVRRLRRIPAFFGELRPGQRPHGCPIRQQLLNAVPDYQLALQAFPLPNQPTAPGATVGTYAATDREIRTDNHYDVKGDIVLIVEQPAFCFIQPWRALPADSPILHRRPADLCELAESRRRQLSYRRRQLDLRILVSVTTGRFRTGWTASSP